LEVLERRGAGGRRGDLFVFLYIFGCARPRRAEHRDLVPLSRFVRISGGARGARLYLSVHEEEKLEG
jgi:hypothetical protein